jgi:3-hydroxy-9,10-secoandrosta-1,3,5(10)-triene-9,17-dione monooxygenase
VVSIGTATPGPEEYLEGVRSILPGIRERAMEAEKLGRMPEATVAALDEVGVFRGLQPRQWGGLELHPATWFESIVMIGSACGSAGWVAGVLGVHPWEVALLDEKAQRDVWGENPRTRLSSSYAPTGKVKRVTGGFELSGCWRFSSGVDLCDWVILGGVPEGEGEQEMRASLVCREDVVVDEESWHVAGLAGSGSKSVILHGAYVPEYRSHRMIDAIQGNNPGFAVNDRPLYRLPWMNGIFAYGIAGPAIGAARGAIEAYREQTRTRVGAYAGNSVAENPAIHARYADAFASVSDAENRMRSTWNSFYDLAERGTAIPLTSQLQCRYDAARSIATSLAAVLKVFEIAGGAVMQLSNPIQRFLRDLLAMRNHPMGGLEATATPYVRAELGLPPNPRRS